MATDVGSARVEVTGDVRNFARQTERELDAALSRMRIDPVEIPVDTDGTRRAGEKAGRELGTGVSSGIQEQLGGGQTLRLFARALAGSLVGIPALIGPALVTAGVGIAAGIAVAAAAVLGSLLGGALAAAGGLGVIGLGAFLLKEEPGLVSAAKSMTSSVGKVFRDAAKPLLEPLIESLELFQGMIERSSHLIQRAFREIAPAVVPFAEGISDMVQNILPGFVYLVSESAPLIENLGKSFGHLGNDISASLAYIADVGPELDIFLQDLVAGLGNAIIWMGQFINWSARMYVALKDLAQNGFESETFEQMTEALKSFVLNGITYVINNLPRLIEGFLEMKTAVINAVVDLVLGIAEALPSIIPVLVNLVISVVTTLVNGLVTAVPQVITAAGELINGLVTGIVNALPTLIPAVISIITSLITGLLGLIPIVIDAGLRLIRGLISGLLLALPEISIALTKAIPQIISAFITAIPQILLLGLNIITAIIQGIGDALPQVADAFRNDVIPTILETLRTEGPKLIEQGAEALKTLMQGWIDNLSIITDVITNDVIPALTELFKESPEILEAGIDVFETILQAWTDNIDMLTTFITDTLVPQITEFLRENPEVADAAINLLVTMIEAMVENIGLITEFVTGTLIPELVDTIADNAPELSEAGLEIMKAFVGSLIRSIPSVVGASNRIGSNMLGAILGFGARMASAGLNLAIALGNAFARYGRDRILAASRAVREAVTGFFGGAASWLVDAGRRIVSGLVSGIQSAFNRVRSVLGTLTGMLPDWKGPAELDKRILRPSGRMVMQGFELGLTDEMDSIKRSLSGITADLPAWVGAPPRGGDGASQTTMLNIAEGAIIIQATDRQGGEEAAEALLDRLAQAGAVR